MLDRAFSEAPDGPRYWTESQSSLIAKTRRVSSIISTITTTAS
jgi:hypothetical protein